MAEILKEIEGLKWPRFDPDRANDPAYSREYKARRDEVREKRPALVLELYKAAPEHEKVRARCFQRWEDLVNIGRGSEVQQEVDGILARAANPKLRLEAATHAAHLAIGEARRIGSFDPARSITSSSSRRRSSPMVVEAPDCSGSPLSSSRTSG